MLHVKETHVIVQHSTTSVGLVIDEDIKDPGEGNVVALILYTRGGHIIYLHRDGYDPHKLLVAGEKYVGESLQAPRYKIYRVTENSSRQKKLSEFVGDMND